MTTPEGDVTTERVNNRYSLVVLAAKRAKQLKEGAPSLIETTSTNMLTIALEEIAAGKVTYTDAIEPEVAASADDDAPIAPRPTLEENFLSPAASTPARDAGSDALPADLAAFLGGADDEEIEEEEEDDEPLEELDGIAGDDAADFLEKA